MAQNKKIYYITMAALVYIAVLGPHCSSFYSIESGVERASLHIFEQSMMLTSPPYACFQWYPVSPDVGQTVHFDASCSFDLDGTIIDYYWSYTTVGSSHFPISMGHGLTLTYSWDAEAEYRVSLMVTDNDELTDDVERIVTIGNFPPFAPIAPSGPSYGNPDSYYTYSTQATDVNEDQLRYGWDWDGDDIIDEWSDYIDNGTIDSRSHTWSEIGIYKIKVKAQDEHGEEGPFSPETKVIISLNSPPNKPSRPTGSSSGKIGRSYSYSSSTTDPDGDRIYYMFDWGDNTPTGWMGPYNSGIGITDSHIWQTIGSYPIKVKAKDDPNGDGDLNDGLESVWSDSLPVSMPLSFNYGISLYTIFDEISLISQIVDSFLS